MIIKKTFLLTILCGFFVSGVACNKPDSGSEKKAVSTNEMGVGPIQQKMTLAAISPALVAHGQKVFQEKCSACHKIGERYVGPDLKGVTQHRQPEWIMNMILNPEEMTQKDPHAKEMLGIYMTQMTFQNVSQDDARAILEFFRQNDAK